MHESDSFISEVSEEVRRDRLFAALRRYRGRSAGAVLLIVRRGRGQRVVEGALGARAEAAGDALRPPMPRPTPPTPRRDAGRPRRRRAGAAVVARLAEAGSLAEAGETDRAAALLGGGGRGRRREPSSTARWPR